MGKPNFGTIHHACLISRSPFSWHRKRVCLSMSLQLHPFGNKVMRMPCRNTSSHSIKTMRICHVQSEQSTGSHMWPSCSQFVHWFENAISNSNYKNWDMILKNIFISKFTTRQQQIEQFKLRCVTNVFILYFAYSARMEVTWNWSLTFCLCFYPEQSRLLPNVFPCKCETRWNERRIALYHQNCLLICRLFCIVSFLRLFLTSCEMNSTLNRHEASILCYSTSSRRDMQNRIP